MRARKAKPVPKAVEPRFTVETLKAIAKDVKKIGLTKSTVSDDVQTGLRANIYKSGQISFIVEYKLPGIITRPYVTIGEHPTMSIPEARQLAAVIRDLAQKGIDVQAGLHERLIAELKRDGVKWRPTLSASKK